MRGALLLAAITLVPAPARADWFVASSTGSDLNACNAANVPCRTIDGAIGKAQAGDTIFVTDDIYVGVGPSEIVHVDRSLTLSGGWNLTFTSQLGYTILDGEHQRRCLTVDQGADLKISQAAFIWGLAADGGGAYVGGGFRGSRLLIGQNRALRGGGIFFNGRTGDDMILIDSVLLGNEYYFRGGGLFVDGFRFDRPTDPNHVSSAFLINVTVSAGVSVNSIDEEHGTPPTEGGGVYVAGGYLQLTHATFAENTIWDGQKFTQNNAGIATDATAVAFLANTLIADGCSVTMPFYFESEGFNVERGNSCNLTVPQDRHGVNPQIYPMNVNLGSAASAPILAASMPAISFARSPDSRSTASRRNPTIQ
jgi:hypothetical protein